jgi:putative oxidoreductase
MKTPIQSSIAFILALVFIYAGTVKAFDRSAFYHDIRLYHLVSDNIAWYAAHYLPWLEIVAGFGLICKYTRSSASILIATLLLIFTGAIFSAWARGLNIECGCFGKTSGVSGYPWILARDIVLLLATVYLVVLSCCEIKVKSD